MKRFLSLLLLLTSFQLSYGDNDESSRIDAQVQEQVTTKFLLYDIPLRYYSNILIKLQGNVTKDDSLIFKQLVDTLNVLIDKWDVYLIPNGTSNLVVNIINIPPKEDSKVRTQDRNKTNEIVKSTVTLYLPPTMEFTARKKMIWYYLLNALAFRITQSQEKPIPGSVFTETNPNAITFLPIDFEIIKKLYSREYDEIFEKQLPPKKLDYLDKLDRPTNNTSVNLTNPYFLIFNLIALLLFFASLIFMSLKGVFKDHNYQLIPFIKQGFLVVVACAFYTGIVSVLVPGLIMKINSYFLFFGTTVTLLVIGMILVCVVFLVERAILKGKNNFSLQILVPFFSIAFITAALLSILLIIIPFRKKEYVTVTLLSVTVLNSLLIGFCRSIYIYTRKMSESIVRKKDVELAQMSELQKQAELQSLRAKINPHFLYNALNSIASLASTDAKKTEQMALALSDFFKYAINREQKQLNSLSEELNATRTYLEIEKVRFGDRLSFEIDCPPELQEIQIPQLLIQPLVENAIKHGLSQITENGLVRISVIRNDDQLKIRVYDNGPSFPDEPLTGFGIRNTQERIALLYGEQASVNWNNGEEKYIELSLPVVSVSIRTE